MVTLLISVILNFYHLFYAHILKYNVEFICFPKAISMITIYAVRLQIGGFCFFSLHSLNCPTFHMHVKSLTLNTSSHRFMVSLSAVLTGNGDTYLTNLFQCRIIRCRIIKGHVDLMISPLKGPGCLTPWWLKEPIQ